MTIDRSLDADIQSLMVMEHLAVGVMLNSEDAAEGVSAFLEKREPQWKALSTLPEAGLAARLPVRRLRGGRPPRRPVVPALRRTGRAGRPLRYGHAVDVDRAAPRAQVAAVRPARRRVRVVCRRLRRTSWKEYACWPCSTCAPRT